MEADQDEVTMFEPRYATKKGYSEVIGRIRRGSFFRKDGYYGKDIGRDVFRDVSEALKTAEQMRQDRIVSLQKSLAKVQNVGPHYP